MIKKINLFVLSVVFSCAYSMAHAADGAIEKLAWLSGNWHQVKGAFEIEEYWMAPKGGTMLAINRSTKSGKTSEFGFLRIVERDGGLIYIASPEGREPVEFAAKQIEAGKAVFQNPRNDFPQIISYTAESPDVVIARIEGTTGGKVRSMEWRFVRTK